jgi:hypothetical protein
MKDADRNTDVGIDGYLFRLIATFEAAAMQQLGKIAHPVTGDVEVDLLGARDSIEMLVAIQRKTEGNLNDDEKRLLEHVLYQLRMNYVDVSSEQKGHETRGEGAEPASGEGSEQKEEDAGRKGDGAEQKEEPAPEEEPADG